MVTAETTPRSNHELLDRPKTKTERQRQADEEARLRRNQQMAEEDNLYANVPCTD